MSRDIVEVSIRRCFSARSSGSFYEPEEGSYLSCCSIAPVDVAHRRPCRGSTKVARHATRACATPADPPKVEEIVAVMPLLATVPALAACAA